MFHAYEVAIQIIRELRPLLERIRRSDRKLEDQARRAAASVALNLSEGNRRQGKDRRFHFSVAAGSASEVLAVLDVAEAFGYLGREETVSVRGLLDRELALTYRLTH